MYTLLWVVLDYRFLPDMTPDLKIQFLTDL